MGQLGFCSKGEKWHSHGIQQLRLCCTCIALWDWDTHEWHWAEHPGLCGRSPVATAALASQQANITQATMQTLMHLLNYCATHPDAIICYQASNMVLWTHSDASYLCWIVANSKYTTAL